MADPDPLMVDLKLWRLRMGLTQKEVGERMGITQQVVSRIESGFTEVRMSTLRRYCMALGVVIEYDLKETQ